MTRTLKFEQLEKRVINWAEEREIFDRATRLSQHVKTNEEVNELFEGIVNNDHLEIKDAIGDICVTLIIQARMNDSSVCECLELAYNEIEYRTGSVQNGIFVKDEGC